MQLNGATRTYCIIGSQVTHSLSPAIHNAAFRACGLNKVYVAFNVQDVPRAMDGLRALGICGVSVTIPHKQAVIPHLDAIDPVAQKIGAVNTLHIDGMHIHGYNTDWIGSNQALETITDLAGATILMLGAGGAARAVGFGLKEKQARVIIANRTLAKAKALARDLNCQWCSLAEMGDLNVDVLVNTTSVGMAPNIDETLVPKALLAKIPAVMDIVYIPIETRLLREARQAGCRTIDGRYMLLYQGVAQFELWTGHKAPVEVMQEQLFAQLAAK